MFLISSSTLLTLRYPLWGRIARILLPVFRGTHSVYGNVEGVLSPVQIEVHKWTARDELRPIRATSIDPYGDVIHAESNGPARVVANGDPILPRQDGWSG